LSRPLPLTIRTITTIKSRMHERMPKKPATSLARHHEEREESFFEEGVKLTETLHSWIHAHKQTTKVGEMEYLFGEVYDQYLDPFEFYEYNPSAQSPIYKYKTCPKARKAEFWLVSNVERPIVIFDKADSADDFGMRVVSNALFGNPRGLERARLDLGRIREDAKARKISDQLIQMYRDKRGNIHSGRFFDLRLWKDPSVERASVAPGDVIGVDLYIEDDVIRVLTNCSGTIIIYRDWDHPDMWNNVFGVVKIFFRYIQERNAAYR